MVHISSLVTPLLILQVVRCEETTTQVEVKTPKIRDKTPKLEKNPKVEEVTTLLSMLKDDPSLLSNAPLSRTGGSECENQDIAKCVSLLEVLTRNDLGFATTRDDMNTMCPVLLNGLQCIDNYTIRCLTEKHRSYFNKLYDGTIRVIKDLCTNNGNYQAEYIHHAPCMKSVNPKYNKCSERYHQNTAMLNHINEAVVTLTEEDKTNNVIILCCSFREYLQCSERVVYEACGNETADFTREFLFRMAGPIVQTNCEHYTPGSPQCVSMAASSVTLPSLLLLLSPLIYSLVLW